MELPLPGSNNSKDRTKEEQIFESFELDSDLLLSKIQFDEKAPESPQINYNTAEAKIKELTQTAESMPFKKSKPFCGCGQYYSCTSSLYLHIRSKHDGVPPKNTIGGPKGIVKKPNNWPADPAVKLEEEGNPNYSKFPSNQQTQPKTFTSPSDPKERSRSTSQGQPNNSKQVTDHSRKPPYNGTKTCKFCQKRYSCNSSLNLHLKRKHQVLKTWDGKTEISLRQEDQTNRNLQCSICFLKYGSKSALGLHFNNKHSSQGNTTDQNFPYDENKVQRCGCGLIYQSRSALNMHVKKKHGGNYPEGTTQKANLRGQTTQFKEEKQGINRIENYLVGSQENSDEEQHSIYDSESDNRNVSGSREKAEKINNKEENGKIFKCGCGKPYTCSSSLNLHIKRNHNWVVPEGTIGGPRGMRLEEESKQASKPTEVNSDRKNCDKCQGVISGSYFHCKKCNSHQMCSSCFWSGSNTSEEHEWTVREKNNS